MMLKYYGGTADITTGLEGLARFRWKYQGFLLTQKMQILIKNFFNSIIYRDYP